MRLRSVMLAALWLVPVALCAQDLPSVPVSETQVGVEHREFVRRDGADPERTTGATGAAVSVRYSLLGQIFPALARRPVALTDWVQIGASWAQVSGRNELGIGDSRVILPLDLGVQLGSVVGERVQVVGRVGASGGIGVAENLHPFAGVRVRSGRVAVELQSLIPASEHLNGRTIAMLRWYPDRLARVGHLGLQVEEVRVQDANAGARERSRALRLFLSRER